MIVLDTNVVSEPLRPSPAPEVMAWFAQIEGPALYLTAITEAELRAGVAFLPEGKRRTDLATALEAALTEDFAGAILPFDSTAAKAYAEIAAARRQAGRKIGDYDLQIAAIARAHHARLATRNVKDFEGLGLKIINPWDDGTIE